MTENPPVRNVGHVLPSAAEAERRLMRARQAEALRQNLRKRKDQQRRRAEAGAGDDDEAMVPAPPPHIVDEEV